MTHAYLVKKALHGEADPRTLYGATAPDMFENGPADPLYSAASRQAHAYPLKMTIWAQSRGLGSFALGFISHNEVRGADFYAHKNGMTTGTGYVIAKAHLLNSTVRSALEAILARAGVPAASVVASQFAQELAHPLVETAIDILVHYRDDPEVTGEMAAGAASRPSSVSSLVDRSFGIALREQTGLDRASIRAFLAVSEESFRQSMIDYAEALAAEENEALYRLAGMGSRIINGLAAEKIGRDIGLAPEDLVPLIRTAMEEVEGDYQDELERVAVRLQGYLKVWGTVLKR